MFQADFDATGLGQDTQYLLTMNGTYQVNEVTFGFTLTNSVALPPASPGSGATGAGTAPAEDLSGAPFPPQQPTFGFETNEPGPPVPTGPFIAGTPTPQTSLGQALAGAAAGVQAAKVGRTEIDRSAVSLNTNEGFGGLVSIEPPWHDPAEPSGASGGGVVFVSFNSGAAYLAEGASSFTILDPTTIFSQKSYGFCCDQHVQYVPKIDRFVWLQQLTEGGSGTPGAYRLAAATPSDIVKYKGLTSAWKSWLITPEGIDLPHITQFDYPSMSVGDKHLFVSWDTNCPKGAAASCTKNFGREIIRIPLSEIKDAANPIHFGYTHPAYSALAFAAFVTQDTGDEVFWPGHNGTNQLRIFSWADSSDRVHWRDRAIDSYYPNQGGCINSKGDICKAKGHTASVAPTPALNLSTPLSSDWLLRAADENIVGATRNGSTIWFAWNAAPNPQLNIPQPYIEMVEFDTSAEYSKTSQVRIWNPDFAFGLPSLSSNACTKEIGLSLDYGGGTQYPNHAVGFWGDYIVYPTTGGNVSDIYFGDYVTIRQNNTPDLHGAFFDAFGYAFRKISSAGSGSSLPLNQVNIDIRHVVFGRPGACAQ